MPHSNLAVTTAVNDTQELNELAERLAIQLNAKFIVRDERPMHFLFDETGASKMIVVRRDRFILESKTGEQYQFHPNLATVRAANYARYGSDHFLEAMQLQPGEKLLDCTLGFGSESLLAAMAVGESGEVVGLESVPELAIITREGMQRLELQQKRLQAVMRRVVVLNHDYRDYLRLAPSRSYDVVYFDPFFETQLGRSMNSVGPLATFGNRSPLDIESVSQARRVAKRIVAIKHVKWHRLPEGIVGQVTQQICGRRSTVAYSIISSYGMS